MNPLGLIVIGIGIIAIVVGIQGSQKNVLATLKGSKTATTAAQQKAAT